MLDETYHNRHCRIEHAVKGVLVAMAIALFGVPTSAQITIKVLPQAPSWPSAAISTKTDPNAKVALGCHKYWLFALPDPNKELEGKIGTNELHWRKGLRRKWCLPAHLRVKDGVRTVRLSPKDCGQEITITNASYVYYEPR